MTLSHNLTTEKKSPRRFIALDSWRGIAALVVVFGHIKTSGWLSTLPLATTSYRFVDFFFVLSGFVIAYSSANKLYGSTTAIGRFLLTRVARLWPLHLFVLGCFILHQVILFCLNQAGVISEPVAFSESFLIDYLPYNVFLIQAWDLLPGPSWNKPAWSISTEIFAYIVFAVSCLVFRRSIYILFSIIATTLLAIGLFRFDIMNATYSEALIRCLAGFSAGVAVYWIYKSFNMIQIPLASLVEIIVIILTLLSVLYLEGHASVLIIPVFSLTIFVFAFEQGRVSLILRKSAFTFTGERSYSIYLTHSFCAFCVFSISSLSGNLGILPDGNTGVVLPPILADLVVVLFIVITVIVSICTHRFIEIPGQQLGKNLINKIEFLEIKSA